MVLEGEKKCRDRKESEREAAERKERKERKEGARQRASQAQKAGGVVDGETGPGALRGLRPSREEPR